MEKLHSALPFLKGTSVIRYFTNFICKDKNRHYTSCPYSLLKNETIRSTSSFHAPLFKMGGIRSSTLRRQSFLKGQTSRNIHPYRFSFSRHFILRSFFKEAVRLNVVAPFLSQYLYRCLTSTKTACRSDKRREETFRFRRRRPAKIADYRATSIPKFSVYAAKKVIFDLNENALKNIPVRQLPTKCIPPAPTLNRIVRKMLPPFVKNFRNP